MSEYLVKINGHSDDLVEIEIFKDGEKVFANEYCCESKTFTVNKLFAINFTFGFADSAGWAVVVYPIDEDKSYEADDIIIYFDENNAYSPTAKFSFIGDLIIPGVYGGKEIELRETLGYEFDIDDQNKIVAILKLKNLL